MGKNKLRLLIDMDSVCAKTMNRWLELYNRDYDDTMVPTDVTDWDLHQFVKRECHYKVYEYLASPKFFATLDAFKDCSAVLKRLQKAGHDLVLVTACPRGAETGLYDKIAWVKKNLPFLPRKNMITAHRKELVRGDLLLDDGAHNITAFQPYGLTCVFNQSWNQTVPSDYRVSTWLEFEQLITELGSK